MLGACVAGLAFEREDQESVLSPYIAVYSAKASDNNSTSLHSELKK